jgi:hypothetical protein
LNLNLDLPFEVHGISVCVFFSVSVYSMLKGGYGRVWGAKSDKRGGVVREHNQTRKGGWYGA